MELTQTVTDALTERPAAQRLLESCAVLIADAGGGVRVTADGEVEELEVGQIAWALGKGPHLVCHAGRLIGLTGERLPPLLDVLELFAFTRPASFCVPTIDGLAEALDLPAPRNRAMQAMALFDIARTLMEQLQQGRHNTQSDAAGIAAMMGRAGWPWGEWILAALNAPDPGPAAEAKAMKLASTLPEWEETAPDPPPGTNGVEPAEATKRLWDMLSAHAGKAAEPRPQQKAYAEAMAAAFNPRTSPDYPVMTLAEAGTGTGKTLGYLAPATLWAEKNDAPVWVATYTRNLQRQIDDEMTRLYPDPAEKARRVVVRKGRENYLCLLNFDDAVAVTSQPRHRIALGLMARWLGATRDGDLQGGDMPGWLPELVGHGPTYGLSDRRGECLYSACRHYKRCFIERQTRKARKADIVIANHALAMIQAANGAGDAAGEGRLPLRYVFDEGHHLFDAADSAFAIHLSGFETAELRRWITGNDGAGRRQRGLSERVEGLTGEDKGAADALQALLQAARALPGTGWMMRVTSGETRGAAEGFFKHVRQQVLARATGVRGPYSLECPLHPVIEELDPAAKEFDSALARMIKPAKTLADALGKRLEEEADELDTETRRRLTAITRQVQRRIVLPVESWRHMLADLFGEPSDMHADWFGIERRDGREMDVGYHRHWIDPTLPFWHTLASKSHGLAVTSATLTDAAGTGGSGTPAAPANDSQLNPWQSAIERSGAAHSPGPVQRHAFGSPFDYASRARVIVVQDVDRNSVRDLAAAYRSLFIASGGAGIGLFTAIRRMAAVHDQIAAPLAEAGIPLLAQHLQGMDVATLVEIFRASPESCLIGTDAVRDGVDVPGDSLRLIVAERVPWPRPDILHKARRERFGGRAYDERIARFRLKQAFGRLIRRADDHGTFILLDRGFPTALHSAFPPDVTVEKMGLAEACKAIDENTSQT
ncbi:MAG: ATP-dependent DNA helicase [Alphaproteobacteria bacterium]